MSEGHALPPAQLRPLAQAAKPADGEGPPAISGAFVSWSRCEPAVRLWNTSHRSATNAAAAAPDSEPFSALKALA